MFQQNLLQGEQQERRDCQVFRDYVLQERGFMVRSLYTAWTGMRTEQKRLDVISNNMANSATVGYKKEGVTSQSFDEQLAVKIRDSSADWKKEVIGTLNPGVKIGEVYTDYSQSSFRETGNTYDLAIDGTGFFEMSVTDEAGVEHTRYTRAGQFTITREGYVVNVNGDHLMGEGGYLQVPVDATEIAIDSSGTVYADGELVDKVLVKDFENYDYLKKYGDTMYEPVNGATEKETMALVMQGYTEQSNVNIVSEMVSLINITRAYEAGQKVIQSVDGTLQLATSSVGKV